MAQSQFRLAEDLTHCLILRDGLKNRRRGGVEYDEVKGGEEGAAPPIHTLLDINQLFLFYYVVLKRRFVENKIIQSEDKLKGRLQFVL